MLISILIHSLQEQIEKYLNLFFTSTCLLALSVLVFSTFLAATTTCCSVASWESTDTNMQVHICVHVCAWEQTKKEADTWEHFFITRPVVTVSTWDKKATLPKTVISGYTTLSLFPSQFAFVMTTQTCGWWMVVHLCHFISSWMNSKTRPGHIWGMNTCEAQAQVDLSDICGDSETRGSEWLHFWPM